MRRLIIEEPYSAAAVWSRRLAVFALVLASMALLIARIGAVDMTAALAVLAAALLIAGVALLFAATATVVIWRTGRRGVGLALVGAVLALAILAYPGFLALQAIRLPLLNDITTDLTDPPAFSLSAKARTARGGYTHADQSQRALEEQRRAYPDAQPIILEMEGDEAYQMVLKAIAARGWHIIETSPPGGRSGLGHIDAVANTLVMGFPCDVAIRIRPLAGQTRIDLRSASRLGRHDFGDNAARIQKFADELQSQVEAQDK